MPPIVNQPPYDIIETVLNFARIIANDCGLSLAGNLLADSQPYTFGMLELAWRKLQNKLGNNAIESLPREVYIPAIPAQAQVALTDPGIPSYLNFSGFWDGVSLNPNFVLPNDLIIPLRLWERPTGQNAFFIPMRMISDGFASFVKTNRMSCWEWRDDAIYFPGASQSVDLKIRYRRILPDLPSDSSDVVPLIRCAVALAYLTVEIFTASRGSTITAVFSAEKDDAIKQLINTTTRQKQRSNFRRRPYSRRFR